MLKIDVDRPRGRLSRAALLQRARIAGVELLGVTDVRSPSGRGWHRYLAVRPAPRTAIETVALQLLFGSDPIREAFNLTRARLVDRGQVSKFFAARFNTLYATSKGRAG